VRWSAPRREPVAAAAAAPEMAIGSLPQAAQAVPAPGPLSAPLSVAPLSVAPPVASPVPVAMPMSDSGVWARPQDLPGTR
jgi:hypothetical protein